GVLRREVRSAGRGRCRASLRPFAAPQPTRRRGMDMSDPRRVLITAPTAAVVTMGEAKRHLRVDHDDDDALIGGMIAGVVEHLDPAGKGWLGRALQPQTWELRLDAFPCGPITLPYPP